MTRCLVAALLTLALLANPARAQDDEYAVKTPTLNMRSGPGTQYTIVRRLLQDETVSVLEKSTDGWWYVECEGDEGYVLGRFLARPNPRYLGWQQTSISSGEDPGCYNFSPEYDYSLENHLKVMVGSNTDVVIKLMQTQTERCIRYVYIRSNETFFIKNIPQGVYYLKIAYGRDWRQKVIDGQCYGKFMKSAQYEKGSKALDFRLRPTSDGYQIPYFELFLNVVQSRGGNTFHSNTISESDFNN